MLHNYESRDFLLVDDLEINDGNICSQVKGFIYNFLVGHNDKSKFFRNKHVYSVLVTGLIEIPEYLYSNSLYMYETRVCSAYGFSWILYSHVYPAF